MESLEYYKSLVTENEVINALIKDSKVREGEVEKSRVRPNLTFFQRTVTNLVSSNKRITVNQEKIRAKEKEKNKFYRRKKIERRKLPIDQIKEILSNKIEFVKSSEETNHNTDTNLKDSGKSTDNNQRQKKTVICRKSPFEQIREILTNNKINKQNTHRSINNEDLKEQSSGLNTKICINNCIDTSSNYNNIKKKLDDTSQLKIRKKRKQKNLMSSSMNSESLLKSRKLKLQHLPSFSEMGSISLSSSTDSDNESCVIIEDSS